MNRVYHCGKFPDKVCAVATYGGLELGCKSCNCGYYKTTVKQYFKYGGKWNVECDTSVPYRAMNVDIQFINSDNKADETQFSIKAYDINELSELFTMFCKENNYPRNTVQRITVVEVAETMDQLS